MGELRRRDAGAARASIPAGAGVLGAIEVEEGGCHVGGREWGEWGVAVDGMC